MSMGNLAFILVAKVQFAWEIKYLAILVVQFNIINSIKIHSSVDIRFTLFKQIQSHRFEYRGHYIIRDQVLRVSTRGPPWILRVFLDLMDGSMI